MSYDQMAQTRDRYRWNPVEQCWEFEYEAGWAKSKFLDDCSLAEGTMLLEDTHRVEIVGWLP